MGSLASAPAEELVFAEGLFDLLPAHGFLRSERAGEFLELEQIRLRAGGERLRFVAVVGLDKLLEFRVVHHRRDLLREAVHVAVAALQLEGGSVR